MLSAASFLRHPPQAVALARQARELEGVFLNTLTKTMFSAVKTDGAFGGGFGEETWRGMQAEQLADSIAKSGGIGLADAITSNLLDAQRAAVPTGLPGVAAALSAYQGVSP
jgi:flagellar protein FlgJ